MKKIISTPTTRYICLILSFAFSNILHCQNTTIRGVVTEKNGTAVEGVNITYQSGSKTHGTKTDKNGVFELRDITSDSIFLKFNHLNYRDTTLTIHRKDYDISVNVALVHNRHNLATVVVSADGRSSSQKKDTTIYFAKAYKINDYASAHDLFTQKIPGASAKDGNIYHYGVLVNEALIDGKEYYKDDIILALKNLPANVINEIRVFDKESDYSRLTGFDDGVRKKTINIVTKKPNDEKLLGQFLLGGSHDNHYDCLGNLNWFKNSHKIAAFCQINNINKQDFSSISLSNGTSTMTPGQSPYSKGAQNTSPDGENGVSSSQNSITDGFTTTRAAGINYTYEPDNSKISLSSQYIFSNTENETSYDINDFFFVDSIPERQQQNLRNNVTTHRFNSKLEYNISPKDIVIFRPQIIAQKTNILDNNTLGRGSSTEYTIQNSDENCVTVRALGSLTYVHKIGRRGTALSIDLKGNSAQQNDNTHKDISITDAATAILRVSENKSNQSGFGGTLSYVQPIKRKWKLKFDAILEHENRSATKLTEQNENNTHWALDSMSCGMTSVADEKIGGKTIVMYTTNKLNIVAGSEMSNLREVTSSRLKTRDTNYLSLLPFLQIRWYLNSKSQLHFNLTSDRSTPNTDILQDAATVINPLLCVVGNSELKPYLRHDISLRWIYNNAEKSNFIVLFAKYNHTENYIATTREFSTTNALTEPQIVSYCNSDEPMRSAELFAAYGFPFKLIKSNINLSSYVNSSIIPGYFNGQMANSLSKKWKNSLTVGSNISENVDFVIDIDLQLNDDYNKLYHDLSNTYWTLSYGGQLVLHPFSFFKFTLECGHTGYWGGDLSKYNATICNSSISLLFGNKKNSEIQFSVNDIFNQNNNFYTLSTELYRRETNVSVMKRFFMLRYIYRFNKFNNNKI